MKTAFLIVGSPGAGKSTFGAKLARERGAMLLDIDTVTGRMVEASLTASGRDSADRDSDYFKITFRDPIYETLFDIARENLAWSDVVIVGPLTKEIKDPHWPKILSERLAAAIEVIYVYCSPEERKKRLETRNHPRDMPKLKDWEQSQAYYGDEKPPVFPHRLIDTTKG